MSEYVDTDLNCHTQFKNLTFTRIYRDRFR